GPQLPAEHKAQAEYPESGNFGICAGILLEQLQRGFGRRPVRRKRGVALVVACMELGRTARFDTLTHVGISCLRIVKRGERPSPSSSLGHGSFKTFFNQSMLFRSSLRVRSKTMNDVWKRRQPTYPRMAAVASPTNPATRNDSQCGHSAPSISA